MNTRPILTAAGVICALVAGACTSASSTPATSLGDTAVVQAGAFNVSSDQRGRLRLETAQIVSFRPSVQATGNVSFNGDRSTQVLSPISGPATRIVVGPGTVVTRGQPLAYVSSPDFAAAVAEYRKAQTAFRNAKRIADRDSALFKNDAIARGDLEQAQADVAAADADLDAALQQMRALGVEDAQIAAVRDGKSAPIEAIVRAPIDGTVVEKLIADGQLLQAGTTPCFTIADLSTMWVMANVFTDDLKDVAVGQPVDVRTDGGALPIRGRVDYVASLVDPGTKAVSVRVVVPNGGRALRRDMFVTVAILARREHHSILIPTSAILRDEQNLPFVFVSSARGFARRRIDLGARVGNRYEVTGGLTAGDQVVGDGALFLQFAESQ
jgi:membrane fusion protein, heavy metal efflux system